MLMLYVQHIWFKVCRPSRYKYGISSNCILVLSGAYLYNLHINKTFTRYQLLMFVTYFNRVKIGKYMSVLIGKGYMVRSGNKGIYDLYSISEMGIKIIEDIKVNYDIELNRFISKYKLTL